MKTTIGLFLFFSQFVSFGQLITTLKYDSDVYKNTMLSEKLTAYLKANDTVEVKSYYTRSKVYFIVKDTLKGYIYWDNLVNTYDLSTMRIDAESQTNKGRYWVGMSSSEASRYLGVADSRTELTGSWGRSETWYFKKDKLYLNFENGILTSYYTAN